MAKQNILIVEDNPMNMQLFTDILEAEGYSILQAVNGKDGFEKAKKELPDLILLDPGLPDIRGIEIVRKFKEEPKTKDIILVVCTASIMEEEKKRIMDSGYDGFIAKPIDTREFPKTVTKFLREKGG